MRVRMMKGDFVVVDILNSNPPVTDIVQVDIIRYPNRALASSFILICRLLFGLLFASQNQSILICSYSV